MTLDDIADQYCLPALQAHVPDLGPHQHVWGRAVAYPRFLDEVVLTFDRGVPVAINGETVTMLEAIRELGAAALIAAHQELENVTLDSDLARFKRQVEQRWAELVHDGLWCSPLKHALDSFIAESQEHVSGEVRLVLPEGRTVVTGCCSEIAA